MSVRELSPPIALRQRGGLVADRDPDDAVREMLHAAPQGRQPAEITVTAFTEKAYILPTVRSRKR